MLRRARCSRSLRLSTWALRVSRQKGGGPPHGLSITSGHVVYSSRPGRNSEANRDTVANMQPRRYHHTRTYTFQRPDRRVRRHADRSRSLVSPHTRVTTHGRPDRTIARVLLASRRGLSHEHARCVPRSGGRAPVAQGANSLPTGRQAPVALPSRQLPSKCAISAFELSSRHSSSHLGTRALHAIRLASLTHGARLPFAGRASEAEFLMSC